MPVASEFLGPRENREQIAESEEGDGAPEDEIESHGALKARYRNGDIRRAPRKKKTPAEAFLNRARRTPFESIVSVLKRTSVPDKESRGNRKTRNKSGINKMPPRTIPAANLLASQMLAEPWGGR
jgi:hypothetical protein